MYAHFIYECGFKIISKVTKYNSTFQNYIF